MRIERPVYNAPILIIYEDEDLLVVDKPPSMPVHPTGAYNRNTVKSILEQEEGYKDLKPVHRLDKVTSGIQIFGKNVKMVTKAREAFNNKEYEKTYYARVGGKIDKDQFTVERNIEVKERKNFVFDHCDDDKGKYCRTDFEVIYYDEESDSTLLKCKVIRLSKNRENTPDKDTPEVPGTSNTE